jgi:hypothetical protein
MSFGSGLSGLGLLSQHSTKGMTMPTEATFRQFDAALQSEFELLLQ